MEPGGDAVPRATGSDAELSPLEKAALAVVEGAHSAGVSGVDFEGATGTLSEAVIARAAAASLLTSVWVWKLLPDSGDTAALAQLWEERGVDFFTSNLPPAIVEWMGTRSAARMKVVGHRGASDSASENTMKSVLLAFQLGADGAEFDVQRSADGQIFLLHDDTLRRTAAKGACEQIPGRAAAADEADVLDQPVNALSYADVIRHVNVDFKGTGVETPPLLTEVMARVPPGKFVFCEVKGGDTQTAEAISELTQSQGWTPDQLIFIAFDLKVLRIIRGRLPAFRTLHIANAHARAGVRPGGEASAK